MVIHTCVTALGRLKRKDYKGREEGIGRAGERRGEKGREGERRGER